MTFFDELYDRFHELHAETAKALEGLPDEALDWVPGKEMNSINALFAHAFGAERYWIGDMALEDPKERDREAEFGAHGLSTAELKKHLDELDGYVRQGLTRLSLADLEAVRTSRFNNKKYTVAWSLAHALEHTALHLGHIQITRQLWEQRRGK